ncbi:MAG: hypothetical protein HY078_10435 [Elusimicrobia bacterium]|nr:hypothetical protein [Elusimicrobiota bacterium]
MAYDRNQIDQLFQRMLSRAGTNEEHSFLQPYFDAGHLSAFELGQFLQGSPEATQSRLSQQQTQYGDILTQANQRFLSQAADTANAQFAQSGRQWSSGQGNSILQAGQQLAAQQAPSLAEFYGQGQRGLNNQYSGIGDSVLSRAYGLKDEARQRAWDIEDYYRMQNDYNGYLNAASRRNRTGALVGLGGAVAGGLIGMPGGPMAMGLGASIGSKVGQSFGSF